MLRASSAPPLVFHSEMRSVRGADLSGRYIPTGTRVPRRTARRASTLISAALFHARHWGRSGNSSFNGLQHGIGVFVPVLGQYLESRPVEILQESRPQEVAFENILVAVVVLGIDHDPE